MAADLLGFISNILNQRQNESQFGRELESGNKNTEANRALEAARQAEAARQFGQSFGLDERQLTNQEAQQKQNNLLQLSQILGSGASNMGQADILSMLAGNLGYNTNPAALLNSAKVKARSGAGGGGGNGSYYGQYSDERYPAQARAWDNLMASKIPPPRTWESRDQGKTWS